MMTTTITQAVEAFQDKVRNSQVNLHSFILMKGDQVMAEWYQAPYGPDVLHRMYSVTKSLTALAIGLLEEEGKLSITDGICDYFPEYVREPVHPWLQKMRIVDMLSMESCFSSTTFKKVTHNRWVESFFEVEPDHCPGTVFFYDTSASVVLAALVEKLSGMKLLDYLKQKAFNEMRICQSAYVMQTPDGVSHGGSGLMCTTRDLAGIGYLCSHYGMYHGRQLLPEGFVRGAMSRQTGTGMKLVVDERQGYGWQMWKTRHGGTVMYGLGGQLVLMFPKLDFVFVTTAYAHGDQSGLVNLYNAFYDCIYPAMEAAAGQNGKAENGRESGNAENGETAQNEAQACEALIWDAMAARFEKTYICRENSAGWKTFRLSLQDDRKSGVLQYENRRGSFSIPFACEAGDWTDSARFGRGPAFYLENWQDTPADAYAFVRSDRQILLRAEMAGEEPGTLFMEFGFRDDEATVCLKSSRDASLSDYAGCIPAVCMQA